MKNWVIWISAISILLIASGYVMHLQKHRVTPHDPPIGYKLPKIYYAIDRRSITAVEQILLHDKSQANARDMNTGDTPLYFAISKENYKIVRLLLMYGADPNIAVWRGDQTPLHYAATMGNIKIIHALINSGANVNVHDYPFKATPLHYACDDMGSVPVVKLILSAHADIEAIDSVGETPLMHAIKSKKYDIIKLLLSYGAKTDVINDYGESPIQVKGTNIWEITKKIN